MLRVAIAISVAGGAFWAHQDEGGAYGGVTVDLARALAADLGRDLQIIAYPTPTRSPKTPRAAPGT